MVRDPRKAHGERLAGVLAAALVLCASPRAHGAEAPGVRSVRIDYEAPQACPDGRAFEAQVRGRSAKIAVGADGATLVRVRIGQRGGRFEGELLLTEPGGREAHRHVEGACGDVASALALITALALDPTASTAADPGAAAAASAATSAANAPAPGAAQQAAEPSTAGRPAQPPRPDARDAERAAAPGADLPLREEDARAHSWGWSVGAQAGFTEGVAPSTVVSVPAFLDVWRRAEGGKSAFSPALRLRFERADSGSPSAGAGADFTWTAGSLDLCPVAWAPGRFRLAPCARVEGGALSATGTGVAPVRSDTRPWVSVGLVARARLVVVGALFLEIEGGALAPLVRDRFFVEPDATIQQAPVVAFAGAAGGGVTFW